MTRIAIIDGHPDPDRERYVHALADAYGDGASAAHEVKRIEVATLDFPILRSQEDWLKGAPGPAIADAQGDTLGRACRPPLPDVARDVPGLFKTFRKQVARPNFAFRYRNGGFPEKLLKGPSVRVIVTMGMPATFYSLVYRATASRV